MIRLQGTDGVRKKVKLSSDPDLAGIPPQDAFLARDVMTEQFIELYTYCRARQMIEEGLMAEGEEIVIGWDTRDPSGMFTEAAVTGLLKAGAAAAVIGVMPTPAIAVYARSIGAAGGVAVTASHNPASYNGIKIFTRRGFKLLPGDDVELSRRVMETGYVQAAGAPVRGKRLDRRDEAMEAFVKFSLDPFNIWIGAPETLKNIVLIADLANGAMSAVAERVLRRAGFGEVIIVNDRLDGSINVRSGVAELEGMHEIAPAMIEDGGRLYGNEAITSLFKAGRKNAERAMAGEVSVCAAVFDGDGDRFYRADYDPFTDTCFILTGDEISILQAGFIKEKSGGKLFLNTVESDLAASGAAADMGYKTDLTAVGDKWILFQAALSAIRPAVSPSTWREIEGIARSQNPSADAIEKILDGAGADFAAADDIGFAIGAEESGHGITPARVMTSDGYKTVFAGNGLKSCLTTFAATAAAGMRKSGARERLNFLRKPFTGGFKKTIYIYHVDKSRWRRGEPLWNEAREDVEKSVISLWDGARIEEMTRPEEPDMLYMKIMKSGAHAASVFIRNSGTEDKTGVSLRGPIEMREGLLEAGETAARVLLAGMKDFSKPMARAEIDLLDAAGSGGDLSAAAHGLEKTEGERLLSESGFRQGLISASAGKIGLTGLGRWYLSFLREKVK